MIKLLILLAFFTGCSNVPKIDELGQSIRELNYAVCENAYINGVIDTGTRGKKWIEKSKTFCDSLMKHLDK